VGVNCEHDNKGVGCPLSIGVGRFLADRAHPLPRPPGHSGRMGSPGAGKGPVRATTAEVWVDVTRLVAWV
jgi:hypothetical protein